MNTENTNLNNMLYAALKQGNLNVESLTPDMRDRVIGILANENIKKARLDFHTYVCLMANEVFTDDFKDGQHIKIICKKLMEVEESIRLATKKQIEFPKRMQLFLPPGAMKSVLVSILFVSWFLGRNPNLRVLQLGASTDFAVDIFGRKVKTLITTSEKFKLIFPECSLKSDTRSAQRFDLTKGGGYYAAGAGSGIAGRRADLLICDDVVNEQTAYSDAERTKIVRWYIPGARSRLKSGGAEIIVNTRWHVDDLSAYLLRVDEKAKNKWEVFSIPAILDKDSAAILNLKEGESFWPAVWPTHVLLNLRDSYLAAGEASRWSALYMQNPVPEEGNIVKREYLQWYDSDTPPRVDLVIVSVDTAYETSKRSDYSAVTVWGLFKTRFKGHNGVELTNNNIILLEAVRGKWELPELILELKRINRDFQPDWFIVEKKASGISVIQELRRCPEIPLFEFIPDKDKSSRLQAALPTMKQGCVWFPVDQPFVSDVVTELLQFPAGKNDDYVDTVSMTINWMRKNSVLLQPGERGYYNDEDDEYNNNDGYDAREFSYWAQLVKRS